MTDYSFAASPSAECAPRVFGSIHEGAKNAYDKLLSTVHSLEQAFFSTCLERGPDSICCLQANGGPQNERARRHATPSVQSRIPRMNQRTLQRVSALGSDGSTDSDEDGSKELPSKQFYENYTRNNNEVLLSKKRILKVPATYPLRSKA